MSRYKEYLNQNHSENPDNPGSTEHSISTKEQIILAASTLFLKNGFTATTARQIAQEANVALGLIPYHFQTKDNLAQIVFYRMMEEFYTKIDYSGLGETSSAEKLYIDNLLFYRYLLSPNYPLKRFYLELNANTGTLDEPSQTAQQLSMNIIHEYKLNVSALENSLYLYSLVGSGKLILTKYWKKELTVTYDQLTDLLFSNYFYNIGLPDQEIADIIKKGKACEEELWNFAEFYNHF